VQRLYRMRGITDPCAKAREIRSRKCAASRRGRDREQGSTRVGLPEQTSRKVLDIG
jgi:hypothetical protein